MSAEPHRSGSAAAPVVSVRGLRKQYPSVVALDDVDVDFGRGEVVGIVGKNGAGKSTLIKVLCGAVQPDAGRIELDGEPVELAQPAQALDNGIVAMHQQLETFAGLTVAENLLLGTPRMPRNRAGVVRWRELWERARETLAALELDVDPRKPIGELSVAEQRMVTLTRALVGEGGRMVILDEPTESLTAAETESMFARVRQLRAAGLSVIYVSHRLDEVSGISDRIVAMRDGRVIAEGAAAEFDRQRLVELIAGRSEAADAHAPAERVAATRGEPVLVAEDLAGTGVRPSSFTLHDGEIVGLCGLVGSGRSALARLLAGATRIDAGELTVDGERLLPDGPQDAILAGVVHVPEDRREQALFPSFSLEEDVTVGMLERHRWGRTPFLSRRAEVRTARRAIEELGVAAKSGRQPTATLSGGNQQKVVLARWLLRGGRVLVLDEPTQGIDVGTRKEILELVRRAVAQGGCALWISSDFQELLTVADRLLVMREHEVAGELSPIGLAESELLHACLPVEGRAA